MDAVLKVTEPGKEQAVDLKVCSLKHCPGSMQFCAYLTSHFNNLQDIKVIKKLGGTVEDTELIDGLVFTQKSCGVNGPKRVEKAKIGLIQFCISPPKTDVSIFSSNRNI